MTGRELADFDPSGHLFTCGGVVGGPCHGDCAAHLYAIAQDAEAQLARRPEPLTPTWLAVAWIVVLAVTFLPLEGPPTVGAYLFADQFGRLAVAGAVTAGWILGSWRAKR